MEKKISFITLVSVALSVCCSAALAGSPMGPPRALVGHRRWVVDFEYAHQKIDLETCGHCTQVYDPLWWDNPFTSSSKFEIKDLKSDMFLGSLGYGLRENVDVFVRLGAADAKDEIGPIEFTTCPECEHYFDFDGGSGFAWGLGTRATFWQKGNLAWGGLFQITWVDPDRSKLTWQNPEDPEERLSGKMDLDWREVQIATGPTWKVTDGLCIYGGPFWLFVRGDLDVKMSWLFAEEELGRLICSHDVKEQSQFGGYCGALWDLARGPRFMRIANASLYAECQFTDDAWGIGLGCIIRPHQ